MTRIQDFYNDLQVEMDYDNSSIMAGLDNGDIEIPDYAGVNAKSDEVILFDSEEGGVDHWSAIHIKENKDVILSGMLNFSKIKDVERAVEINKKKDINYYETLCLYCADNDIDLKNVSDNEFDSAVEILSNYGLLDISFDLFFFWID